MVLFPTIDRHRIAARNSCKHCCHDRYAVAGMSACPACDEALRADNVGRCEICRCSRDIPPFSSSRMAYFGLVAATLSLAAAALEPWLLVGVVFVGFSALMRANSAVAARRRPDQFDPMASFVLALFASYGVQLLIAAAALVILAGIFAIGVPIVMSNRIAEALSFALVPAPFVIALVFYVLVSRKFWPKRCTAAQYVAVK